MEGTTGEIINDAVYERNAMMEETYNFVIEQVYSAADQLAELRTAVSAGDEFQAAIVLGTSAAALAQEGCLHDLHSLPYVDFSGEWWDQNAVDAFTMMDKMFFTSGDMNTVLTVYNDRSVQVTEQLFTYLNTGNTEITCGVWAPTRTMFTENRALFANVAVSDARNFFRESCEEDFGFLPIAKYDEEQDRYYNLVAFQDWTHLWCVPTTCTDTNAVGFLLEAFAFHSRDTVRQAYYDITLSGKVVRDKDSGEMLDLIFDNRVYDIATIYDWGGWNSYFSSAFMNQRSNSFAAVYRNTATKAQTQLSNTIAAYERVIG